MKFGEPEAEYRDTGIGFGILGVGGIGSSLRVAINKNNIIITKKQKMYDKKSIDYSDVKSFDNKIKTGRDNSKKRLYNKIKKSLELEKSRSQDEPSLSKILNKNNNDDKRNNNEFMRLRRDMIFSGILLVFFTVVFGFEVYLATFIQHINLNKCNKNENLIISEKEFDKFKYIHIVLDFVVIILFILNILIELYFLLKLLLFYHNYFLKYLIDLKKYQEML